MINLIVNSKFSLANRYQLGVCSVQVKQVIFSCLAGSGPVVGQQDSRTAVSHGISLSDLLYLYIPLSCYHGSSPALQSIQFVEPQMLRFLLLPTPTSAFHMQCQRSFLYKWVVQTSLSPSSWMIKKRSSLDLQRDTENRLSFSSRTTVSEDCGVPITCLRTLESMFSSLSLSVLPSPGVKRS